VNGAPPPSPSSTTELAMKTLLPLYVHPLTDPLAWAGVASAGGDLTVVVNVQNGPGRGLEPAYAAATDHLCDVGVPMLGYVNLGYATRPMTDILDDVAEWTRYRVAGIFFDQAPTSPFCVGPVAMALRMARRVGLGRAVLNPGLPTDSLYRQLAATICTYEGSWTEYLRWPGDPGSQPGDGHLVYGVPAAALPAAHRLLAERGAGFGLATDLGRPQPYAGLPAWCRGMATVG
jgi:hypothetical protein